MATPVYNLAGSTPGSGGTRRTGGLFGGSGSMFGGITPSYLGAGQPALEGPGSWLRSWFSDGTPVYRAVPSKAVTSSETPSETPCATTTQLPMPQPGQVAIVVPRP
jgi:hypothetical protein